MKKFIIFLLIFTSSCTPSECPELLFDSANFITYDSDKNQDEISQWKVQGFPTIIVKKGEEAMEYVGPNQYDSVLNFIESI